MAAADSLAVRDPADASAPTGVNHASRDWDEVFASLAVARRRAVLEYLREADPPVEVGELASHVAERERQGERASLQREKWEEADTALELCHLPAMDDAGLVAFDEERRAVANGEWTETAWEVLDALDRG